MMTWPAPRNASHRERRSGPWHRDDTAAALSIARWEDDGGRIVATATRVNRPPATSGVPLPPEAQRW